MSENNEDGSSWQSISSEDDDIGVRRLSRLSHTLSLTPHQRGARPLSSATWITTSARTDRQSTLYDYPEGSYQTDSQLFERLNRPHSSNFSDSSGSGTDTVAGTAPSLLNRRIHQDDDPHRNVYLFIPPAVTTPPTAPVMDNVNVAELADRLGSDEDAVRKMAVFKLQSNVGDPSFAEIFILEGGLPKLKYLIMKTNGNTLAYSLASFSRLLEVDKGWESVDQDLVERVVELVVTHPLVNILRGAMGILVSVVSRPYNPSAAIEAENFGFKALKPAIAVYPQFLEMLVSRLSSADHALCANALQLINSLMRDAITNDSEAEWPKFIKRLQDLGVIKAVYVLMQSSAIQDLAHPLLEFQALTKILLRRWKDVPVDLQKTEHRRALKGIHLASNPERPDESPQPDADGRIPKHNPEKWRRLGFESESPAWEFQDMGFLGMMDLTDYVRKNQDEFERLLLEQSTHPLSQRCPIARASLATTAILYEHFEVDKSDVEDAKSYLTLESRSSFDKVFKPLLLHWSRLHVASLHAFFRLWKATGAEQDDFIKILELVRILVESVVGGASRTKDVQQVEEELGAFELQRLRELQMELLELTYEDVWGPHLRQVKDELQHEALQFVKEQRARCLLQGTWFPNSLQPETGGPVKSDNVSRGEYRYIKLSHNRRYLHYADFDSMAEAEPELDALPDKSKFLRP